jgi:hypothetical protein
VGFEPTTSAAAAAFLGCGVLPSIFKGQIWKEKTAQTYLRSTFLTNFSFPISLLPFQVKKKSLLSVYVL